MKFRFSSMLRKYTVPYVLIQSKDGYRDDNGDWHQSEPVRKPLRGHIQPLDAELRQGEGGRYTEEAKALYTSYLHSAGEVVEYQGNRYIVNLPDIREYSDVQKYVLEREVTNGSV